VPAFACRAFLNRRGELRRVVDGVEDIGFICADRDAEETLTTLASGTVGWTLSASGLDYQSRNDPRVGTEKDRPGSAPHGDVMKLIADHGVQRPPEVDLSGDDVASRALHVRQTGPPKGAMNTDRIFLAMTYRSRSSRPSG
jgi:long-chain acyl-CoA synthetase